MPAWYDALDEGQRRLLLGLGALVAAVALVVGGVVLVGGDGADPAQARVETNSSTSTTGSSSTTSSSTSSTSTTVSASSTTTTARGGGATTTTRRAGGGTGTTRPTTATTKPPTTSPPTQPPSGGPCATGGGSAGQMATLYCQHRAGLGLPSTSRNSELDAMAQAWAQKMANEQALSHRPNTEARQMVAAACDCPGWAENVAYDGSVQEAFDGWLASSAHRGHIEDGRDGEHGLGVASAGGFLWIVQVFGYYG